MMLLTTFYQAPTINIKLICSSSRIIDQMLVPQHFYCKAFVNYSYYVAKTAVVSKVEKHEYISIFPSAQERKYNPYYSRKNDILRGAYILPSYNGLVWLNDNVIVKMISATQKSSTVPLNIITKTKTTSKIGHSPLSYPKNK